MLDSSAVDHRLEPRPGQTKDYKLSICCVSGKHAALRSKSKYWFDLSRDNLSERSDMSTRGLLIQ